MDNTELNRRFRLRPRRWQPDILLNHHNIGDKNIFDASLSSEASTVNLSCSLVNEDRSSASDLISRAKS